MYKTVTGIQLEKIASSYLIIPLQCEIWRKFLYFCLSDWFKWLKLNATVWVWMSNIGVLLLTVNVICHVCALCHKGAEQSSTELPKQSYPVLFGMPQVIPPDSSCCSRRSQVPVDLVSPCQHSWRAWVPQVSAVTVGWAVTKPSHMEKSVSKPQQNSQWTAVPEVVSQF